MNPVPLVARYIAQTFKTDHLRTGWTELIAADGRDDSRDIVGR
jgi:hypothetical protein